MNLSEKDVDDDDAFDNIRVEEGNALLRIVLEYGRDKLFLFGVGGAGR